MGIGEVRCVVAVSADQVWAVLGDFQHPGVFIKDLESIEIDGDTRTLKVPGAVILEQLLERDDQARRLIYSIRSGLPIDSHRSEIHVSENGSGSAVTWSFEVAPDEMVGQLTAIYQGALDAVIEHFGG